MHKLKNFSIDFHKKKYKILELIGQAGRGSAW